MANLITKSFSGELEDWEEGELKRWLAKEGNREWYEELRERDLQAKREEAGRIDGERAWRRLEQRVAFRREPRKLWRRMGRYAAALALPVAVGMWLWQGGGGWKGGDGEPGKAPVVAVAQLPEPGSPKAMLVLADGKRVDLTVPQDFCWIGGGQGAGDGEGVEGMEVRMTNRDNTLRVGGYAGKEGAAGGEGVEASAVGEGAGQVRVDYQTLEVPVGGEYRLVLPDGTRVWLNADTRLRFPSAFPGGVRRVELEGEAYFEVAHRKGQPFVVAAQGLDVQVLGTKFNVKAYAEDAAVYMTLAEGAVKAVDRQRAAEMVLEPDRQCVYAKATGRMAGRTVDAQAVIGWTAGKFVFENEPLEEIMKQLGRWYDTKVVFRREELKGVRFTGRVGRFEDISTILRMMEKTYDVTFNIQGKTITVGKR